VGARQALPNVVRGIQQLELNAPVGSPGLQEQQHAQTTAFQGLYLRQVEQDNASVGLLSHCIAQPESGITSHNPALAVNDNKAVYSLDVQAEHNFSPKLNDIGAAALWPGCLPSPGRPTPRNLLVVAPAYDVTEFVLQHLLGCVIHRFEEHLGADEGNVVRLKGESVVRNKIHAVHAHQRVPQGFVADHHHLPVGRIRQLTDDLSRGIHGETASLDGPGAGRDHGYSIPSQGEQCEQKQ
jgi:hypothetical protein